MISYPNQKLFIINKKIEEGDIFIMLRWNDFCMAAEELSPSALKLYMYLAKNKDGYEFYFSSKDFCQTFNIVDRTYRNAKEELIRKGYLKEGNNNKVHFSADAAFKETKENLKEELTKLASILKRENTELYKKLCDETITAKLKEIDNEDIYKFKIKNLINFAQDLIEQLTNEEFDNLC